MEYSFNMTMDALEMGGIRIKFSALNLPRGFLDKIVDILKRYNIGPEARKRRMDDLRFKYEKEVICDQFIMILLITVCPLYEGRTDGYDVEVRFNSESSSPTLVIEKFKKETK